MVDNSIGIGYNNPVDYSSQLESKVMARPRKPIKRVRLSAQIRVDYALALNEQLTLPGDFAPPHGAVSQLVESLVGDWLAKKGVAINVQPAESTT